MIRKAVVCCMAAAVLCAQQQNSVDELLVRGRALVSQKQLAQAESAFLEAAARAPESFEAHFNLGLCRFQQQRPAEAAQALMKAAELKPSSFEANYLLGAALSQTGQTVEAIRRLVKARSIRQPQALLTLLGVLYMEAGYPLDAAETLEQALKLGPAEEKTILVLIQAYHDSFDFQKSLQMAEEAVTRFPGSGDVQFRLGYELETAGRFDEAEAAYTRALSARPAFAECRVALARLRLRHGDYAAAQDHLERALDLQPANRQVRIELARALMGLQRYARATEILTALIREADLDPAPHYLLSQIYRLTGELTGSARERARFLQLSGAANPSGGMSTNIPARRLRRFAP